MSFFQYSMVTEQPKRTGHLKSQPQSDVYYSNNETMNGALQGLAMIGELTALLRRL